MPDPRTDILGGDKGLFASDNPSTGPKGVYAVHPAAQLKYNTSWKRSQDTQARLILSADEAATKRILASLPAAEDRAVATVKQLLAAGGYIDFLLHSVSESDGEVSQVVESLADDFTAYYFGRRPRTIQLQGTLFSTVQDDWWTTFTYLYEHVLRGSKLAALGATVSLRYDSRLITGALNDFTAQLSDSQQMAVNFNCSMLVYKLDIVPNAGGPAITKTNQLVPTITSGQGQTTLNNVKLLGLGLDAPTTVVADVLATKTATPPQTPEYSATDVMRDLVTTAISPTSRKPPPIPF